MNSNESTSELLQYLDDTGLIIKRKNNYTSVLFTDMTKISSKENNIIIQSGDHSLKNLKKTTSFFISIDNNKNNLIDHLKLPNINLRQFKDLTHHINDLSLHSSSNNSIELKLTFNQKIVPALQTLARKSSRF